MANKLSASLGLAARAAGAKAYANGFCDDCNPYVQSSNLHGQWAAGWYAAKARVQASPMYPPFLSEGPGLNCLWDTGIIRFVSKNHRPCTYCWVQPDMFLYECIPGYEQSLFVSYNGLPPQATIELLGKLGVC